MAGRVNAPPSYKNPKDGARGWGEMENGEKRICEFGLEEFAGCFFLFVCLFEGLKEAEKVRALSFLQD